MPEESTKFPVRISVSEAARLFGVEANTVRRAIKNNEIKFIVVQGRYKLDFESLVAWSKSKATVRHKTNNKGIGQFVAKWKE